MMKHLLVAAAVLTGTFTLLLGSVRAFGLQQPNPAAVILDEISFEGPQSCWLGICPATTYVFSAEAALRANPSVMNITGHDSYMRGLANPIRWEFHTGGLWSGSIFTSVPRRGTVATVMLYPKERTFRLGDLMLLLGEPVHVGRLCVSKYIQLPLNPPLPLVVTRLTFKGGIQATIYKPAGFYGPAFQNLEPMMPVATVYFAREGQVQPSPWFGFGSIPIGPCR